MANAAKIREDYELDLDYEIQTHYGGVYSEENVDAVRKGWEIAWCFDYQPDNYEWTQDHNRYEEVEDMWEEYENSSWDSYYRKAYRGEPLPDDLRRYLRNDGVADWLEVGFRRA